MTVSPSECHGRQARFPSRPPAGTSPWDCYWATVKVPIYSWNFDADGNSGRWGETRWSTAGAMVLLNYKLTDLQRTATLAHELHHLDIGGVCRSLCSLNERKVIRASARWLLPDIERLAVALRTQDVAAAARELGQSSHTIWERLECLTGREQSIIAEVMGREPVWLKGSRITAPLVATSG